jgi:hypothetical protein
MKRLAGNPNPYIITDIYLDVKIYIIKVYRRRGERQEGRTRGKGTMRRAYRPAAPLAFETSGGQP